MLLQMGFARLLAWASVGVLLLSDQALAGPPAISWFSQVSTEPPLLKTRCAANYSRLDLFESAPTVFAFDISSLPHVPRDMCNEPASSGSWPKRAVQRGRCFLSLGTPFPITDYSLSGVVMLGTVAAGPSLLDPMSAAQCDRRDAVCTTVWPELGYPMPPCLAAMALRKAHAAVALHHHDGNATVGDGPMTPNNPDLLLSPDASGLCVSGGMSSFRPFPYQVDPSIPANEEATAFNVSTDKVLCTFDGGVTWWPQARLPSRMDSHTMVSHRGKLYVLGGVRGGAETVEGEASPIIPAEPDQRVYRAVIARGSGKVTRVGAPAQSHLSINPWDVTDGGSPKPPGATIPSVAPSFVPLHPSPSAVPSANTGKPWGLPGGDDDDQNGINGNTKSEDDYIYEPWVIVAWEVVLDSPPTILGTRLHVSATSSYSVQKWEVVNEGNRVFDAYKPSLLLASGFFGSIQATFMMDLIRVDEVEDPSSWQLVTRSLPTPGFVNVGATYPSRSYPLGYMLADMVFAKTPTMIDWNSSSTPMDVIEALEMAGVLPSSSTTSQSAGGQGSQNSAHSFAVRTWKLRESTINLTPLNASDSIGRNISDVLVLVAGDKVYMSADGGHNFGNVYTLSAPYYQTSQNNGVTPLALRFSGGASQAVMTLDSNGLPVIITRYRPSTYFALDQLPNDDVGVAGEGGNDDDGASHNSAEGMPGESWKTSAGYTAFVRPCDFGFSASIKGYRAGPYNTSSCQPCTTSCPSGFKLDGTCSTLTDFYCVPCTACPEGFIEATQCTHVKDTLCIPQPPDRADVTLHISSAMLTAIAVVGLLHTCSLLLFGACGVPSDHTCTIPCWSPQGTGKAAPVTGQTRGAERGMQVELTMQGPTQTKAVQHSSLSGPEAPPVDIKSTLMCYMRLVQGVAGFTWVASLPTITCDSATATTYCTELNAAKAAILLRVLVGLMLACITYLIVTRSAEGGVQVSGWTGYARPLRTTKARISQALCLATGIVIAAIHPLAAQGLLSSVCTTADRALGATTTTGGFEQGTGKGISAEYGGQNSKSRVSTASELQGALSRCRFVCAVFDAVSVLLIALLSSCVEVEEVGTGQALWPMSIRSLMVLEGVLGLVFCVFQCAACFAPFILPRTRVNLAKGTTTASTTRAATTSTTSTSTHTSSGGLAVAHHNGKGPQANTSTGHGSIENPVLQMQRAYRVQQLSGGRGEDGLGVVTMKSTVHPLHPLHHPPGLGRGSTNSVTRSSASTIAARGAISDESSDCPSVDDVSLALVYLTDGEDGVSHASLTSHTNAMMGSNRTGRNTARMARGQAINTRALSSVTVPVPGFVSVPRGALSVPHPELTGRTRTELDKLPWKR